jgi:ferredoxin-fold anticodon binding domain-containing protein
MDQLIDTTNTKIHWNKTRKSTISILFQHHTEETSKLRFLRNKINISILLAYADDLHIITKQINTMDIILQHMITNLKNFGMEINPDKSSISIRSLITPSTRSTYQMAGLNIKTTKKKP